MAIGGDHNQHTLDSMETYDPAVGQWVIVGALPKPLESLKAINIDGRILLFGKKTTFLIFTRQSISGGYYYQDVEYVNTILEYNIDTNTFDTVGFMTEARSDHAVSVVKYSDYSNHCVF